MKLRPRNKISSEFSMATMSDIVFLLLIFFMLTFTVGNQNFLDVKLPRANGTNSETQSVVVSITAEGQFYIDKQEVQKEQLETQLQNKFNNQITPSFIINADENALHKEVIYVMAIANKNKYKILIATKSETE